MSSLSSKASEPVGGALGSSEKNKQWQRELLMERLRSHSNQHKTFPELSKAMRMSMLEKRYALDAVEKSNLQKCLDSMQHCIKVTTRQGLVERLESLSRQLGLKFMEDTSGLFISSDMFYLEIIIDHNGTLSDVKVHHECKIEQQSCSELVNCLLNSDFVDFTVQLEGLSSIYQLNAEPKVKSKAFVALQAMETDLYNLFTMQNFHKDTQTMLMASSVGIVQKRRGGHPMKLTYFVHPYDLLNLEAKTMLPLTLELIATKNIGMSVTVNLEASSANKLQILPTVSFNPDPQGASIPIYSPMTSTNSTLLPATFVLRLNKPLPVCDALRQTITHSTESNLWDPNASTSIMQHIVQTASDGQMQHSSRGLCVTLPDQNHCYFFTENKKMKGSIITSVPFTEPSQVPKILSALKRQALFHTLLGSCVRTQSKMGDLESTVIVEVNAISIYQISVALQHPFEESMATIEFDLSDATTIMCRVYSLTNNYDVISVKLSKIAQISLSIPVTVRALLKYWEQERLKPHRGLENGNFNLPLGPSDPGGRNNDMRDIKTKSERNINGNFTGGNRQFFHPSGVMMNSSDAFSENSVNMFCPSNESSMMNQFAMKTNNEMNFTDVGAIKGYQTGEDFCKSPKSNVDINCPQFSENSDSSSLGTSTPTSDSGVATHAFQKAMRGEQESILALKGKEGSDLKGSNMAVNEIIGKGDSASTRDKQFPSTISITPVSGEGNPLSGIDLNKRPGIEIIPITGSTNHPLSTSITITPINAVKGEKKSNSSKRNEDRVKGEKKRKRKKEDLSMGPPEKMISKQQEVLNRQLTASGKLSLDSSMSKLSHSVPSKLSPSFSTTANVKTSPKGSPVCTSLKYLPGGTAYPKTQYSITSPKQGSSTSSGKPSMSALKSVTNSLSPKSDRSKASNKERDHREKDRIKVSVGGNSPKIKSSAVKLKQIDLNSTFLPVNEQSYFEDGPQNLNTPEMGTLSSASGGSSGGASQAASQPKVRKNSLNAVIDKLKSAQNTGDDACQSAQKLMETDRSGPNAYTKLSTTGGLNLKATSNSSNMNVNSEYMIKPSLDGMKITINKTRSKDSPLLTYKASSPNAFSKIGSHSSSGSPKKHTGLKPGTISGPASKKGSPQFNSSKSSSALSLPASQTKSSFQKSHSSGNLTAKGSTTSKNLSSNSFSEAFRKDKSNKSKNAINEKAPVPRPDPTDVMKILRFASPNNAMEGFMKSLNTKFQIPKLSARSSDDSKKAISTSAPTTPVSAPSSSPPIASSGSIQSSTDSIAKSFSETMTKNSPKFPLPLVKSNPDPLPNNTLQKVSYPPIQTSPMFGKDFHLPKSSSSDTVLAMHKDQPGKQFSSTPPTPSHMTFSSFTPTNAFVNSSPMIRSSPSEPVGVQAPHSHEMAMRPPSAPCAVDMTKNTELDLSMKSENRPSEQQRSGSNSSSLRKVPSTQKMSFPPSPSVSLHIVKSPAPSPLVLPSPHSNSPCITDDELMDEALVGIGGK